MLWREYKIGLNGIKPAQQFMVEERNLNKAVAQMYSRRNNVWQCIQRLVNAGFSLEVAIQKIHAAYGYNATTTKVIKGMIADKKKYAQSGGSHPDLQ